MKQRPSAHRIIKRLKRVWDSCETKKQKDMAIRYIALAIPQYGWSSFFDADDEIGAFNIVILLDKISSSEIRKEYINEQADDI